MSGKAIKDRIGNELIRKQLKVAPM